MKIGIPHTGRGPKEAHILGRVDKKFLLIFLPVSQVLFYYCVVLGLSELGCTTHGFDHPDPIGFIGVTPLVIELWT